MHLPKIKLPPNIYFGCFGNPMRTLCTCCNTEAKNLENYTKYLDMAKNWKQLGYKKEEYEHEKGFFIFLPK